MVKKKNSLATLAEKLRDELNDGNIDYLGKALDEGWKIKKTLSKEISNGVIDDVYETAVANGAVGGKLLGAGGNGFILLYVEKDNQQSVKDALSNLREMKFDFESEGSQVIYNDE